MRPATLPLVSRWATRPHATRLRYLAGCRCMVCRAANSRYETHRNLKRAQGDWNGIVDAAPARARLRALEKAGIGSRRVADMTGISRSIVVGVRAGRRQRMRARSVRKILFMPISLAPAVRVPAVTTWVLLDALIAEGYPKRRLAHWLGQRGDGLQVGRVAVTVRMVLRVQELYAWLTASPYTPTPRSARGSTGA